MTLTGTLYPGAACFGGEGLVTRTDISTVKLNLAATPHDQKAGYDTSTVEINLAATDAGGPYMEGRSILVREKPPLRLHASILTPQGNVYRWGQDEPLARNVLAPPNFSTTLPGGFEQCNVTLGRKPGQDYPDLAEFSQLSILGASARVAWQGRLESAPEQSGADLHIAPGAVGMQAHLDDRKDCREIYIDCNLSNWIAASASRKIELLRGNIDIEDASVSPGADGLPALVAQLSGPWSRERVSEGWYDSIGIPIGHLIFRWSLQTPYNSITPKIGDKAWVNPGDWDGWQWYGVLADVDASNSAGTFARI